MDAFDKFYAYLMELHYPNIDTLNFDEVADIFSGNNRFFLLSWLAKYLNSNFTIPSDESEKSLEEFADFFCDSGFCLPSQKYAFVKGDDSLGIDEQIDIFVRIFDYIKYITSEENVHSPSTDLNSIEDLSLFLNKDINLFPQYGPSKPYSSQEKLEKIKFYEQEITKLKESLCDTENTYSPLENIQRSDKEWRKSVEESIKTNAEKLEKFAAARRKKNLKNKNAEIAGIETSSESEITKCSKEVANAVGYFKNMHLSQVISKQENQNKKLPEDDDVQEMINQLAQTSSKITEDLKK